MESQLTFCRPQHAHEMFSRFCRPVRSQSPANEDAAVDGLGLSSSPLAPAVQALMCHLACQVCKELIARHAAVEGQQIEESVNVHLSLHMHDGLPDNFATQSDDRKCSSIHPVLRRLEAYQLPPPAQLSVTEFQVSKANTNSYAAGRWWLHCHQPIASRSRSTTDYQAMHRL